MAEDLPIYSDLMLRSGMQFADLARFDGLDKTALREKADRYVALMEGAQSLAEARLILEGGELSKERLLQAHGILFKNHPGAGEWRETAIGAFYRGQDCPEPIHIPNSIDNFFQWMTSESVGEIHPVEKAGLALTRTVDIWPFNQGNLTVAVTLANRFLRDAGLGPFFVTPNDMREFDKIVGQAVAIETQPLVSAIYKTIKREMEALSHGHD